MRRQISNFVYGLLDYAAYPFGMLALAPIVLRHLGAAQYGVWAVATATVSFGSIVASGFGDANIQQVATRRGTGGQDSIPGAVRASFGIHLILGTAMALLLSVFAPILANRLSISDAALNQACLSCIRIAALLTVIRAVETVCISTQRAFERYGAAVRISIAGRMLSLAAAAVLAAFTRDVVYIMLATTAFAAMALMAQFIRLRQLLDYQSLTPSFDPASTRELIRFGIFTWLLSATGVMFSQADRLIAGASMGATAVVSALCAQMSQPVYGITAAGLHFLFPHLASRRQRRARRVAEDSIGCLPHKRSHRVRRGWTSACLLRQAAPAFWLPRPLQVLVLLFCLLCFLAPRFLHLAFPAPTRCWRLAACAR